MTQENNNVRKISSPRLTVAISLNFPCTSFCTWLKEETNKPLQSPFHSHPPSVTPPPPPIPWRFCHWFALINKLFSNIQSCKWTYQIQGNRRETFLECNSLLTHRRSLTNNSPVYRAVWAAHNYLMMTDGQIFLYNSYFYLSIILLLHK